MNERYYTTNYNNLEEWLSLVNKSQEVVYPFCRIPYQAWLNEYLETIQDKTFCNRQVELNSF